MHSQSTNRKTLFSGEFVLQFEGQLFHHFLSKTVCLGGEAPYGPGGAVTDAIHTGCSHALIPPAWVQQIVPIMAESPIGQT